MAKTLALITLIGFSCMIVANADELDTCIAISECFHLSFTNCNNEGQRKACLEWKAIAPCQKADDQDLIVCGENDLTLSTLEDSAGTDINMKCSDNIDGGRYYNFGIRDAPRHNDGTFDGDINLPGAIGDAATCTAWTSTCSTSGNDDFLIKIWVPHCPQTSTTTPTTTTTTTTTTAPMCTCGDYYDTTACGATCGPTATKTQKRDCMNCPAGTQTTRTIACPGVPSTCPTPAPSTSWTLWNQWGSCSKTCGTGVQRRTRTCSIVNTCPGSSFEERSCHSIDCPNTSDGGTGGTGGGRGGRNPLRVCRRRARRGPCRRLKGRRRRQCIRRQCF